MGFTVRFFQGLLFSFTQYDIRFFPGIAVFILELDIRAFLNICEKKARADTKISFNFE